MKIINNDKGEAYELEPGTELEIERTNPFFNEYGEQTLPVNLPNTEQNRRLTSYPDLLNTKNKASAKINATIMDGDYVMQCRQAILGSQKKNYINTSFYMNEGSFYSRISEVNVKSIFGSEVVEGVSTVQQAIDFCTSLLTTNNEKLAIFPVIANSDSGYKYINRLAWMNYDGSLPSAIKIVSYYTSTPKFYNSFERTEIIDDVSITIPIGFYITPFIKVNYLLKRVFSYFGYTLLDNFFSDIAPFSDMVFLNNTMDTIVKGVIKYADIVPDCTVDDILNIFRYKFHCEFIPDEINKTISVKLFKECITTPASIDLTNKLTSEVFIDYPETYKQIKLSSESSNSDLTTSYSTYDELKKSYPAVELNKADMNFYRVGFSLGVKNYDKVASSALPYKDLGELNTEEISVPDCHPTMIDSFDPASTHQVGTRTGFSYVPMLFVGDGNFLNSSIKYENSTEDQAESNTKTEVNKQLPMLAFYYDATGYGYIHGTISSYNYLGTLKLWNYSLCYFGEDGIFERFYRPYDDILRNSFHEVKADLLLSRNQKLSIPAHQKVILQSQELLINRLKYKIGGAEEPQESEFYSINLYEPVSEASAESVHLSPPALIWQTIFSSAAITAQQYENSEYKDKQYSVFYPVPPSYLGELGYWQYVAKRYIQRGSYVYFLYSYHLEAIAAP